MFGTLSKLTESLRAPARRFARNTRGAVAIYVGFTAALFVGGGVLAIDVGRMVAAMAELQKAADSGALSGATQLSGLPGACARATQLVQAELKHKSKLLNNADDLLPATTITFYELYEPGNPANQDLATDAGDDCDSEAGWIKVELDPHQLDFMLMPVLRLITGGGSNFTNMSAYAVAEYAPLSCEIAPLMQCVDPADDDSPTRLLGTIPDYYVRNAGRQYQVKLPPGGGPYDAAAGNFGLIDVDRGARDIRDALSDPNVNNVCGSETVSTKTGSNTGPVSFGINGRFDQSAGGAIANPAPDIIDYPQDSAIVPIGGDPGNGSIGNGRWNPGTYFLSEHSTKPGMIPFGAPVTGMMPTEFVTAFGPLGENLPMDAANGSYLYTPVAGLTIHLPTRYQTYLWEVGVEFYVNGAMTIYPGPPATEVAANWRTVTPLIGTTAAVDSGGFTGYAGTRVPASGQANVGRLNNFVSYCEIADGWCLVRHRTILTVAVNCEALDLHGKAEIIGTQQFYRYFLIRRSTTGVNADIKGELSTLEGISGLGAEDAVQGNVRLVE